MSTDVYERFRHGLNTRHCRTMRYTDFIDGVVALDPAEERDLFRRFDAGAIADAIVDGYFLAAVPISKAELRRISDDGRAARKTLWRQMWAIVLTQARQAAVTYRCSVEDLIQAGCVGLGKLSRGMTSVAEHDFLQLPGRGFVVASVKRSSD